MDSGDDAVDWKDEVQQQNLHDSRSTAHLSFITFIEVRAGTGTDIVMDFLDRLPGKEQTAAIRIRTPQGSLGGEGVKRDSVSWTITVIVLSRTKQRMRARPMPMCRAVVC